MNIKKCFFIIQVGVFLFGSFAYADRTATKRSYKKITADGSYVFVMLRPGNPSEQFQGYTSSGLYNNNGSKQPLWTVGWYAYKDEVEVASDGVHLIKYGPWPYNYDDEAISFYSDGSLVRSYNIKELVSFPSFMPHTTGHFTWRDGNKFDDRRHLCTLNTHHSEYYAFDIKTGKIISSFKGSIWFLIIITFALLISALLNRILFHIFLVLFSLSLFLMSVNIFSSAGLFFGILVSGNIIAMLSASASDKSDMWRKILNRLRKPKFLLIASSVIIIILIVDRFLTQVKIQHY